MANHVLKHENKLLLNLLGKLDELKKYNQLFGQYLESPIAQHAQVVKFEKNCLFVIVDNGHWATQLRFSIPDLILQLREHPGLEKLNGIICKTRPHPSFAQPPRIQKRQVVRLNPLTGKQIIEIAKTIDDERLKAILKRIAARVY